MDASIPALPPLRTLPPGQTPIPRWLPWVNIVAGVLGLLWMIPSWLIISDMFAQMDVHIRPPAALAYLLTAIPGVIGIALLVVGACLIRRRGYLLCILASAATLLGGALLIVGILNIVQLVRPQVKAQFGRNAA